MEPPRLSLKRALLLSAVLALGVLAQNNNNNNQNNAPAQTTTQGQDNAATTTTNPQPAPKPTKTTQTTQTTTPTDSSSDTNSPTPTTSTSKSPGTLPQLSTDSSTSVLTGLPKLSKTVNGEIPTYPPPTIPPTHNAPFMNHSTLPDGTVFIAVGAILGAFGMAVLAWRGIVACLLHRSVERAALAQHAANNNNNNNNNNNGRRTPGDKKAASSFPAPPAQFYRYVERESSASLAAAGLAGPSSGLRKTHRGPTPSSTPSQTNLFFSPTAAGSSPSAGGSSSANRDSAARFLPSGFYASASSPNPGGHQYGHGNSISMSTLRPSSRGRGGAGAGPSQLGPSPPDSPEPTGSSRVVSRNFSTSSLNLNRPPSTGTRAPSAYLDDLLDDQPGQFPPHAGPAGSPSSPSPQGHGQAYGSQGRRY